MRWGSVQRPRAIYNTQRSVRTRSVTSLVSLALAGLVVVGHLPGLSTAAATAAPAPTTASLQECHLPAADGVAQTATPEAVGLDRAKLDEAIAFAASRMRTNVQVYRNNCLVGRGPLNDLTDNHPWNLFSGTKSVVAMVAGVAYSQGLLDLHAPIGTYLPEGKGTAEHRAITVHDLLTQTSGLKQSIISEAGTAILDVDPNVTEQALALPLLHEPGTFFEYTQHGPNLLAYVVQQAVGQDLQQYAQDNLFTPLGIGADNYHWSRDRSGNTYGYAFLYMPPVDFARLGLLMLHGGRWGENQIISTDFVDQARAPSAANPCYGFLFWTNSSPCTGPSIPSRQTTDVKPMAPLPDDAYAMMGFMHQTNFIVPSLGLLVTWTGALGDVSPDLGTVISANKNSELNHSFLRILAGAVNDVDLPDAGPYQPTMNPHFDPSQVMDADVFLAPFGSGAHAPANCDVFSCGPEPLRPPFTGKEGCIALICLGPESPGR